jgi:alkanesulfonate monooxygenase SsuD/methylene tetrahydromethanopterin reductase-like flavin-dependent oxidoreductase (luciferase family)
MGELSDRFAELMARMAKSDADLFRTIGEQNDSVRQMVDDLAPAAEALGAPPVRVALAASALLPPEQCEPKALKARFGKAADAQSWIESQIGKAPKKPTWLVIEQTCRTGAWPASPKKAAISSKGVTPEQLEERLAALEERLMQRFDRLESLLLLLAESSERQGLPASSQREPMA